MSAWLKTFLMAAGAAAWAGTVTYFHGVDVGVAPSVAQFHNLVASIASAVLPALLAYFMTPPHTTPPPTPPAK